jgi:hypothetical protein
MQFLLHALDNYISCRVTMYHAEVYMHMDG